MVKFLIEYHLTGTDISETSHVKSADTLDSLIDSLCMLRDLDQEVDLIWTFHVDNDEGLPFDINDEGLPF